MTFDITIVLAGIWIGLSKGGIGGPVAGAILLPLLTQTMSVPEAVGITLPLLMFADIFAMRAYWREWDMRHIRLMLPAAIIGILMGTFLLTSLSDTLLKQLLGFLTLGVLAYKLASDSLKQLAYHPRKWHGYLAGWASGFASSLANIGGPPITAYLLLQKTQPTTFVATITLFFFSVNWLKVPLYLQTNVLDINAVLNNAWIFPIIPFGVWIGKALVKRFNLIWFERLMMVLLAIASIKLIVG